jgi:hypothetical protein
VWIEKESFRMLKSGDYNEAGSVERTMEVLSLERFDGQLVASKMVVAKLTSNSSSTITFVNRARAKDQIADSVFDPDNLATFDPTTYGLQNGFHVGP